MIQVFKPDIGQAEIDAVSDVLRSGWIGLGPKTAEFEKKFSAFCTTKYCVGVNSATAALDLSMKLLNIIPGDEVLVPTITFVSTAHAVAYNRAIPVFFDADINTLGPDFDDLKSKISKKTKAIIIVHYGGRPIDMDRLKNLAGNIPIVEDCAHATGAQYKQQPVGSLGAIGCFSFHAVKNLSMGDGGALTMNRKDWAERAKRLRWLGIDKGTWDRTTTDKSYWWQYKVTEIGLKCHMNDISAALGLIQLQRLTDMNNRRKKIASAYMDGLKDIDEIHLPPTDDDHYHSSWHIFHIRCSRRDELSVYLQKNGVSTGVHYTPIHTYKCYGDQPSLPHAETVAGQLLSLPMFPTLSNENLNKIIDLIRKFYGH